jgi:hypothetical protein
LSTPANRSFGSRVGRPGLTQDVVFRTAEQLLREKKRPTVKAVREKIGGSNSTVAPLLDQWWADLAERFARGPSGFDRIPPGLAHVVEGMYLQLLTEARARVRQELAAGTQASERQKMDLDVRSHVLSLREAELEERLRSLERKLATAEAELRVTTVQLRKEQASRESLERRLQVNSTHETRVRRKRTAPTPKRKPSRSLKGVSPRRKKRRPTRRPG